MPETDLRAATTPDYYPERRPRYESFHSGVVAWTLLVLVAFVAAAAAWAAIEVRELRHVLVVQEPR